MNTTEQTPAPWRSRWYSAAKRFGIAVLAVTILHVVAWLPRASCNWVMAIGAMLSLALWVPLLAAAWGLLRPREYPGRPSAGARTGVALLGAAGITIPAFFVALPILVAIRSFDRRVDGEAFTPDVWSFCHVRLHLAPDADLRPAGFRLGGFQDKFVQAKFLAGGPDPARLFDTNAVDLSDVRPGGYAANIDLPSESGRGRSKDPRWWTPAEEHAVSGRARFRDADADGRECMYIAVDALPDGDHALYVFWFQL